MCSTNTETSEEIKKNGFEFLKLDYEQGMLSVKQCHDQKLAYQKFYIAIVSAIFIVSVYVHRLMSTDGSSEAMDTLSDSVSNIDSIVGAAFIFAGTIGYIVVKNLSHIRINAVFYSNAVVDIRKLFIKNLELKNYPDVEFANAGDRKSADYITIILCSFINMGLLNSGVAILLNGSSVKQMALNITMMSIFYLFFHYVGVERTLNSGMKTSWRVNS
ncbi:hypothetical protein [Marinomonas fungiae]|uniref:hypothetical protein n=1 Tax=Marinomonas fungiae TaxID=1137284 RepID=UPI003A90B5C3